MWVVYDFDTGSILSRKFDTEAEANAFAEGRYGEFWWSNETPYAVKEVAAEVAAEVA